MSSKIKTTHVGSLPRPEEVAKVIFSKEKAFIEGSDNTYESEVSDEEFERVISKFTEEVILKQKEIGIDIPSDGEMSKISYATYVKDRLSGFSGDSPRRVPGDLADFKSYAQKIAKAGGTPTYNRPQCTSEIKVKNLQPLKDDINREKAGLKKAGYDEGFMNSASPGVIALFQPSTYHKDYFSYLEDLAEAMRVEYELIVEAGLMLQIDSPDLALGRHMVFPDKSDKEFLEVIERHIEILNHALRNIPGDRIRMHVCWGNYEGPHHRDIELKKIVELVLKSKPRQILLESSNPRHAHEWEVWKDVKLPDDLILCPGVIDSTTNFIEHPELVKQRLNTFIDLAGRERVIASTDCGFATFAGFGKVDEAIVWEKLKSLVQGAALASK